jgi:hypothetical protein
LQEIENHFSGKSKLPRTMKRKEPVSDIPFPPKFDVSKWDSNEKFEKHLQQRKISKNANGNGHQEVVAMGHKRKKQAPAIPKPKSKGCINDDDYDTPL